MTPATSSKRLVFDDGVRAAMMAGLVPSITPLRSHEKSNSPPSPLQAQRHQEEVGLIIYVVDVRRQPVVAELAAQP